MTGWELNDPERALQENSPELESFVRSYPLAALNEERNLLVILRLCQPGLNAPPEDERREIQLHLFGLAYWSRHQLPQSLKYLSLDMKGRTLHFNTDQGQVLTNTSQLSRLMGCSSEEELCQTFLGLTDVWPAPRKAILATQLNSRVCGTMTPADFPDWWQGKSLSPAYFGGLELPVTFMDLHPEEDPEFVEEADQALESFSAIDLYSRRQATHLVWKNCREFLEAIGEEEELQELSAEEDIWSWVTPQQIYLTRRSRRDRVIYLQVSCRCRWEEEHGLQLVFRQGRDLVRVSSEDGHLTDSDAYDFPDQEDALLWPVLQSK